MLDWKKEIGIAFLVRQLVADLDTEDLWPFHLPEVAATEDNLVGAERTLGQKLDRQYREFLRYANGWKAFSQSVDLFGTADLEGSSRFLRANELIDTLEPLGPVSGIKREECMPIAVSEDDIDVFF